MPAFRSLLSLFTTSALILSAASPATAAPRPAAAPETRAVDCTATAAPLPVPAITGRQAPPARAVTRAAPAENAAYDAPDTPLRMIPGDEQTVKVTVRNTTNAVLPKAKYVLSYHWTLPDGTDQTNGSNRLETELPADLAPGATSTVDARVKAPQNADIGNRRESFVLRWDLRDRQERKWLSETAGVPTLDQPVTVEHPTSDQLGLEKFYQYSGIPAGAGGSLTVNQFSGNAVFGYNAITNPSRGLATFFRATYNSSDTSNSYAGAGWSVTGSTLNRLGTPLDFRGNKVLLTDGDGTTHVFERDEKTGRWASPAGVHLLLEKESERWVFTSPDRTRMYFDEDGYQTSTVEKNGNELTFHYERGWIGNRHVKLLTHITDPENRRTLTLDYYQFGDDHSVFRQGKKVAGGELKNAAIVNQLKSVTDISGRTITFTYGEDGLLQELTDGAGTLDAKPFTFFYDNAHNPKLTRAVDPNGNGSQARYFADPKDELRHGHVKALVGRDDGTTSFDYADADGPPGSKVTSTITDANGHPTTFLLDGFGRTERMTNAKGQQTALQWDADNNVVKMREDNGATTTWVYDQKTGFPQEIRDPEASANNWPPTKLGYRTAHDGYVADLTEKTTPDGHKWSFVYDDNGNLVSVTDPKGTASPAENDYTSRYVYDDLGHLSTTTDANGHTTTYADYDANGFPQRITDPLKCSSYFRYDDAGNVVSTVDAKRKTRTFTYDVFGRPLDTRVPKDAATNQYVVTPGATYDRNDNAVTMKAANGAISTSVFDEMDQQVAVTTPADDSPGAPVKTSTFRYDKVGNLLSETEPKGTLSPEQNDFTTTYTYDEIDQLVLVVNAKGHRITASYDTVGNLVQHADGRKNETPDPNDYTAKYRYDLNHRVVETFDAAGHGVTSKFDRDGNVVETTDEDKNVTFIKLDERAMPVEMRAPHDRGDNRITYFTTKYEYDQVGNRTKTITPRGVETANTEDFVQETAYDELNRVREELLPFDPNDATVKQPDRILHSYDEVGNEVEVSAPPSNGQTVRNITKYSHFDNGWLRSSTDAWGIRTEYDYNATGQQTNRTHLSAGGGSSRTQSWTYHPDGKKKTRSDGGVPVGKHVVVVDNSDPNDTEVAGDWGTATGGDDHEGFDYRTHGPGGGGDTFTWKAGIPANGRYEVLVRYAKGAATDATYTIEHNGGVATKQVDQTQHAGTWVSLGSYEFTEDNTRKITLSDKANGAVTADAVQLVRDNSGDVDAEEKKFEYFYDANDNQVLLKDLSSGALTDEYAATYDAVNRADTVEERKAGAVKNKTGFRFDANGNVVHWEHDDQSADYEYDARDLVSKSTNRKTGADPREKVTTFEYTARAHLAKQVKHNGNTVGFDYYLDGLLKLQVERKPGDAVVNEHKLQYNANGHRTRDEARKQNADNHAETIDNVFTYSYDPRDRVRKVEKTGKDPSTEEYEHDANNNVVKQTVAKTTTTFRHDRNRLVSATANDVTSTYAYDPFGRLSKVSSAGEQTEKYIYDGFDHTVEHRAGTGAATRTTKYVFDPLDRTVSQTTSGGETKTVDRQYLGLSEQVLTERENGKVDKSYQYSPHGELLSQVTVKDDGAEEDAYFGFNPKSDVESVTDKDGNAKATYGYTAYGQNDESGFTGEDKPDPQQPDDEPYNSYRFNSKRFDSSTGNYDMGFRDYSPSQNRFLSLDLYNGALADLGLTTNPFTMNRYAFGGGNPISAVELDGHLFGLSLSDIGHAVLDVAGMIPVVGEVADLANAGWYAAEGNYVDAALSAASAIPFAGYAATAVKAGKYADKAIDAVQAADNVADGARTASKVADDVPVPTKVDTPTPPKADPPPQPKADAPDAPKQPKQPEAKSCPIGNSFTGDTLVLLANGTRKAIREVVVGDEVLATDPVSGQTEAKPVEALIPGEGDKDLVEITVDAGQTNEAVTATAEHPFWVADRAEWVYAKDLRQGDWLRGPDGETVRVTAIRTWTSFLRVHNLSITGINTYYVAAAHQDLLVHNQNAVPAPGCNNAMRGPGGQFAKNPSTPPKQPSSGVHGNSLNSPRSTVLYQLTDRKTGAHLKWGVTSKTNPLARYSKKQQRGFVMTVIARGSRKDMVSHERFLTERWPGPLNFEKWAGTVKPSGPGPFG